MGPKIAKMGPKIDPKSMKNRGCVADAFLERFGVALGRPRGFPKALQKRIRDATLLFIDFEPILGAILMIFSRFWHTFWLSLGASVASFCQLLAFKWFASTASVQRCRRSLCNYNRALERNCRSKGLQKVSTPKYGDRP